MPWHSPFPFPLTASASPHEARTGGLGVVALPPHAGAFGDGRKKHCHEGVDIYAPPGTPVRALEDGTIIGVTPLKGASTREDYWRDMEAVLVQGASGLIVYGEFAPLKTLKAAQGVKAGELLGQLYPAGYKFRQSGNGDHGTEAFMHLELHAASIRLPTVWEVGKPQPATLLDPTPHLLAIIAGR